MKLTNVLNNSLKEMGVSPEEISSINESTTSSDITSFASQVGILIKEKFKTSLPYELCDVQPLNTPTGNIFILTKENESGTKWKFVVKKATVTSESKSASTGFTQETWQDLQAMFGEDANDVCANLLSKVSGSVETSDFLTFIGTNAKSLPALVASSYEHIFTEIGKAISKINQKTFRTMEAWAIVPSAVSGNYLADPNYFLSDALDTTSQYLMYKFGKTKIYINPDATDTNVYVGVNGKEPGTSSVVFSPYQYTVSPAIDPDSGQNNLFVFNRFAITMNPLHVTDNEMLYKFAVTMPFEG